MFAEFKKVIDFEAEYMQFSAFHLSDGKCIIKIYILYIINYLSEEFKHLQSKRMKEIWGRKRLLR